MGKLLAAAIAILVITAGCEDRGKAMQAWFSGNCQSAAMQTATVAIINGIDCKIVYGRFDGIPHMQTSVFVDGEWLWAVPSGDGFRCVKSIPGFSPEYEWDYLNAAEMILRWGEE